jgi:radical SAM superfamily enzyme YgiQ (UPF0313 family)
MPNRKSGVDLLIICPGNNRVIYQGLAKDYAAIEPPIWGGLLANFARRLGKGVDLIDQEASGLDSDQIAARALEAHPKLTAIVVYGQQPSASTQNMTMAREIASKLKAAAPDFKSIMLGGHPSSLPEETLRLNPAIDAVVRNEADFTVRELADRLAGKRFPRLADDDKVTLLKTIDGLSFQVAGQVYQNKGRELIQDLDSLPFVSQVYKRHLNVRNYFFAACDYPEVQIMSARGCTDRCTFCVYPYAMHELKYRMRTPKNIVDEFDFIASAMPEVKEVGMEDDTFAGSVKRVHAFCKEKIRRGNTVKWYTNVRATLDLETLTLMRKACLC